MIYIITRNYQKKKNDEIYHWKYVRREWKNGRYRYWYDDAKIGGLKNVIKDKLGYDEESAYKTMQNTVDIYKDMLSVRGKQYPILKAERMAGRTIGTKKVLSIIYKKTKIGRRNHTKKPKAFSIKCLKTMQKLRYINLDNFRKWLIKAKQQL